MLDQLKYTGMLETIRIRREGFAARMSFQDIIQAYHGLAFPFHVKIDSSARNVQALMEKCQERQAQYCQSLNLVLGTSRLCRLTLLDWKHS